MKKYFVIGNPINHSLSPKLHNFWIKKNNIQAIYDKKKLEEIEMNKFIQEIKQKKISGINVTVPFKKKIISYLDKLSSEAEKTQSVNTVVLENNNLVGYNTDIVGFENAIKSLNYNMTDKKIFVLGAGGVVPSIIFALEKMRVSEIILSNRTRKKAENLKSQFNNIKIINWGELTEFDVIINATSLGLNNESINIDLSKSGKNKLFYDVIYNPSETNFLKEGKRLGNQAENGKMMFIFQAQEAFKIWHGINPEINIKTLKLFEND